VAALGAAGQEVDHDADGVEGLRRAVVGQPDGIAALHPELGQVEFQSPLRLVVDEAKVRDLLPLPR